MIEMSVVDRFDIGQRIQRMRREAGYTQLEVAELAGISASYYGNIERGRKAMSVDTFVRIYQILHASANYIPTDKTPNSDKVVENIIASAKRGGSDSYSHFLGFMKRIAHSDFL